MKRHFVSYPKSGRSWVRYALTRLAVAGRIRFRHDGFEFNDGARPPHDFDLEARLARYSSIDRVVYMSRDPRDLMVSLYFQVTGRFKDFFDYRGTLSQFIRDEYFGARNLLRFQKMWAQICARGHALQISYEDCHQDLAAVLLKITSFYGFEFSPAQLRQAAAAASFDNMKKVELSGSFRAPWLRPRNNATKVRRGRVGGYAEDLSAEDVVYLNRMFGLHSGSS